MYTGMSESANATAAVSTARVRSDTKTAARPSSRRRAPSSAALDRPMADRAPGSQPVAIPRSLSTEVAWVSYTSRTLIVDPRSAAVGDEAQTHRAHSSLADAHSSAGEPGRSLLHERRHPLPPVLGREERGEQLGLPREPGREVHRQPAVDGGLGRPDRGGRPVDVPRHEVPGRGVRVGYHRVDQTDPQRLVGGYQPAGEDQVLEIGRAHV